MSWQASCALPLGCPAVAPPPRLSALSTEPKDTATATDKVSREHKTFCEVKQNLSLNMTLRGPRIVTHQLLRPPVLPTTLPPLGRGIRVTSHVRLSLGSFSAKQLVPETHFCTHIHTGRWHEDSVRVWGFAYSYPQPFCQTSDPIPTLTFSGVIKSHHCALRFCQLTSEPRQLTPISTALLLCASLHR